MSQNWNKISRNGLVCLFFNWKRYGTKIDIHKIMRLLIITITLMALLMPITLLAQSKEALSNTHRDVISFWIPLEDNVKCTFRNTLLYLDRSGILISTDGTDYYIDGLPFPLPNTAREKGVMKTLSIGNDEYVFIVRTTNNNKWIAYSFTNFCDNKKVKNEILDYIESKK